MTLCALSSLKMCFVASQVCGGSTSPHIFTCFPHVLVMVWLNYSRHWATLFVLLGVCRVLPFHLVRPRQACQVTAGETQHFPIFRAGSPAVMAVQNPAALGWQTQIKPSYWMEVGRSGSCFFFFFFESPQCSKKLFGFFALQKTFNNVSGFLSFLFFSGL